MSGESKDTESSKLSENNTDNGTSTISIEHLRKKLAQTLALSDSDDDTKVKVLDDVSLDGVVNYIKKNNCKKIITMAGAGISTSAGIPDFRSPGTGLYANLQKYDLPHPQAIFELDFFTENPRPFFDLAKELYPGDFKPTVCHYFIKLLNDKGMLLRHYTQNIDTLERIAGVPEEKLVEAHGTFHTGHCLGCRKEYTQQWMKERIFEHDIPQCEKCEGVVKPDIVFFGEALPDRFCTLSLVDFPQCDLLIIMGSSLAVQPFASLVERAPLTVPRLLINREKAGHRTAFSFFGGLDFESEDNTRDVLWLGNCDDGCQLFADKLGFGDELRDLFKKEHDKINKESKQAKATKAGKSNTTGGKPDVGSKYGKSKRATTKKSEGSKTAPKL